ncbi:hypothetical protein H5410_061251 [Solanum commersonii]|uniref:Uncharacterized protein n=1 Tax=Solanum commersonii TaxID=4109 RepID=A0A9J5W786_SOLCO|nr:hypothetical protein H5410_061251 [Solanum commersonii]
MCSEGYFGDVSQNRRCTQRFALWSTSPPSSVAFSIFVSRIIGQCSTTTRVARQYADCSFSSSICSFP